MDPTSELAHRVERVYLAQRSLGCVVTRDAALSLARNAATPLIYDANFAFDVDPALAADDAALARALAKAFDADRHQKVVCGPTTAPIVEARLVALGFEAEPVLQLVLEGPLASRPTRAHDATIRAAETPDDWAALVRLQHDNFAEKMSREGRAPLDHVVAEQMVESWRAKPDMRFWLASVDDGAPCAYFGSWAGDEGLGMVEYLYTDPEHRHRGIGTALIEHAVGDVRSGGCQAVLIGAEVEDTPKNMYLDLGFRPVCITREWLRPPDPGASGE